MTSMPKGGQSNLSGWLVTKKRGRDDAQISKDQKKALAERKRKLQVARKTMSSSSNNNNNNNNENKSNNSNKYNNKKKKQKQTLSDDEKDDMDYESDFVVDDDDDDEESVQSVDEESDEELQIDSDDDSEELEVVHVNRSQNATRKATRERTSEATFLTLPESSSDEGESFLQSYKPRVSKPSKALNKASEAMERKRVQPLGLKTGPSLKQRQRISNAIDIDIDINLKAPKLKKTLPAGTDCVDLSSPSPVKRSNGNGRRNKRQIYESDDTDNEDARSRYFKKSSKSTGGGAAKNNPFESDSEAEEANASPDSLLLNDTPEVSRSRIKNLKKKTTIQIDDDMESVVDEDERIALEAALKESLQQHPNSAIKIRSKITPSTTDREDSDQNEKSLIDQILEESSEEECDEPGEVYDEEQQAATNVLNTAEQLSAQVLANMQQWTTHEKSETGKDGAAVMAAQGMIVDGALSLGALPVVDSTNESAKHKWISQDTMKIACPDVKLSSYQLIGVNWLAMLHNMKCDLEGKATAVNGVLADEMGLGKTVQTIAFLAWLKHHRSSLPSEENATGPHLIVVPVSVLPNWTREFEKFCPNMNVVRYHGSLAEREETQEELRQYLPKNKIQGLDVILAPVTYFQKEKSDDRRFLNKFGFDYLVVDEAHMLKNSQSTRYRMLNKVSTRHRLLLTGTPVQNSPKELLNMLCFIMPLFASGSDAMEDDKDKGSRMLEHFVDTELEENGDEAAAFKKLKHLFAPFVLRRKKEDVIAQLLPPKERIVESVELDTNGRAAYDAILKAHVEVDGPKVTAAIGDHLFTNLRKAAHHPLLLRNRHSSQEEVEHLVSCFHKYGAFQGEGSTKQRVAEELLKFNDFNIHLTALDLIEQNKHRRPDLERYILNEEDLFSSAKFSRLRVLLPQLVGDGHRILIFSGWTSCLDLLGCLVEYLGLDYCRMDGSTPSDIRQQLIDGFNRNAKVKVFLLSTRACGLGINLTAADTCIIHDLDFNPFNDLQAEDRCHRIGQTKKVTVYKFVTRDTVDADIFNMQDRKSKMNAAIMGSKDEKKERRAILKAVVDRYIETPSKK